MRRTIDRFSNRVENYAKYRPGYPVEILHLLRLNCGLAIESRIADIGSGTGKLSEMFLQNGNFVHAVEPNSAMRRSGEELLRQYKRFESVDGSAESTTLETNSIDFITAGHAFHWFDREKARSEFRRILKPDGWVVIIWNERRLDGTPFLQGYEDILLKYGTDYQEVRHEIASAQVASFFPPGELRVEKFNNLQKFDFAGLKGRISSTSYTPGPGTAEFELMLKALEELFDKYSSAGRVSFEYDTRVYYGRLSG